MKLKILALISLLSLTTACGFQLRGNMNLSGNLAPIYISGQTGSQLAAELRKQLSGNGLEVTSTNADARHRLVLLEQNSKRRSLSIGAGANTVEYQLIETAVIAIEDQQGQVLAGPKELIERRIMRYDPDQVVTKGEEETLLRLEMQQALARKILLQLSATGS